MRKITFILLLFLLGALSSFASERATGGFSYNGQTFELERFKSGFVVNKEMIRENKRGFYFSALALTIGSGLVFTTAVASSITASVLAITYYAAPVHIAMIALSSACWTFFLFFIAPVAVAMWILYGFAVKYERESGRTVAIFADKEGLGIGIRLFTKLKKI